MTRLLGIREAGVWLAYEIIPEVPLPVTWRIVPMFLLAFRTFFWQVQQMNFSYSLPCEHETSSVPVQGARWHRRVALLVLTGLVAFLWMSSRDLLSCRRNGWTLWFTVTMGPGTWKAWASQSSSVLTHELHSVLWAENQPELPGKMLQLGWKSVASLELHMCPKFCSDLTDSNSKGGIAPAQIVPYGARHRGCWSRLARAVAVTTLVWGGW